MDAGLIGRRHARKSELCSRHRAAHCWVQSADRDFQMLCEIENRPSLVQFHDAILKPILLATGRTGFPYILLIDGNDPRGIDVAIMSRHPIFDLSTHVFDIPTATTIFSRDCAE